MRRIIVSVAVGMLAGVGCLAQNGDKYVITGEMTRDSLRFTPQAIRMVYLACQSDGKEVRLDSAVVKNKTFRFEGKAPALWKLPISPDSITVACSYCLSRATLRCSLLMPTIPCRQR